MDFLIEKGTDNIYTRHAREENTDGAGYVMHIHDRCELYFFMDGNVDYLVEGSVYAMKPGSLLLIRPGEVHMPRLNGMGPYERYAVNFPIDIFDFLDPERRLTKPFTDRPLGKSNLYFRPEYKRLFDKICDPYPDDYERRLGIFSALLQIMTDIGNEFSPGKKEKGARNKPLSAQIIEYVNENLSGELSVPGIAEHFYISTSQLSRIFKQYTGASPWEYITAKRLIRAKSMIEEGEGASRAALECGFGDYSAFYRAYIKRFGCAPTEE